MLNSDQEIEECIIKAILVEWCELNPTYHRICSALLKDRYNTNDDDQKIIDYFLNENISSEDKQELIYKTLNDCKIPFSKKKENINWKSFFQCYLDYIKPSTLNNNNIPNIIIDHDVKQFVIDKIVKEEFIQKPKYLNKFCKLKPGMTWNFIVRNIQQARRAMVPYSHQPMRRRRSPLPLPYGTNLNTHLPPLTIEQLPGFPIRYILTFLNVHDIEGTKFISKTFEKARRDPFSITQLEFDEDDDKMPSTKEWKRFHNLKDLVIIRQNEFPNELPKSLRLLSLVDTFIDKNIKFLPLQLKKLEIRMCQIPEPFILKDLKNLELLILEKNVFTDNIFFRSSKPLYSNLPKSIKKIDIDFIPNNLRELTNLVEIQLTLNQHELDNIIDIDNLPPNVKELELYTSNNIIGTEFPSKLTKLKIQGYWNFDETINFELLKNLPLSLKELDLQNLIYVDDDDDDELFDYTIDLTKHTNLEFIRLYQTTPATLKVNKNQVYMASHDPKLIVVD